MDLTSALRIHLLGPIEIQDRDTSLRLPPSSTSRSLLAYLVLHHDQGITRDRLIGIFWPERPDPRARRALSNALWQLRRALGDHSDRLATEQDKVTFAFQFGDWVDVEEFETAISRHGDILQRDLASPTDLTILSQAVSLHRSDFLEGCYDDWALLQRERLREMHLRGLEMLATLHKQADNYERALLYAQQLASADPLRESVHRELMRLYHLLGRSKAALDQFVTLSDVLAAELDALPSPATAALYHEIATSLDEASPAHLPVAPPPPPLLQDLAHLPLVGRANEREALLYALHTAANGRGALAFIEGDAGVGKSRLVSEVIADARWHGLQVGYGKADPLAASTSYGLVLAALSQLLTPLRIAQLAQLVEPPYLGALAQLLPTVSEQLVNLPTLAPLDPHQEQQRISTALVHCLSGLASANPLLLVLEDIHWADDASLSILPQIAAHLADSRILIVLTYRSAEARERRDVRQVLDNLDRALPPLRLRLAPFEPSDADDLVLRALGVSRSEEWATDLSRRLQVETGGNALFLVETLKSLLEQGALTPKPNGSWSLLHDDLRVTVPTSVQDLILERVGRLTKELRTVLETVAVLGDDTDFAVLARASGSPPAGLSDRLTALCQRGFLTESGAGYRFEHDLVRETVYRSVPADHLAPIHGRAGIALEEVAPHQVEAMALHFGRSGVSSKALHYSRLSGERAVGLYDYQAALDHYRSALELVGRDLSARWDVLVHLEAALYVLSDWDIHAEILEEMLQASQDLHDPIRRARTLHLSGRREVEAGDPHKATELLEEALELAQAGEQWALEGRIVNNAANAHWRLGDTARCQACAEEAQRIFTEIGDLEGLRASLNTLVRLHLGLTGDYGQALENTARCLRIARELDNIYWQSTALANMAITYAILGDYGNAQEHLDLAFPVISKIGDLHTEGALHVFQAVVHRGRGRPDEARDSLQEALQICRLGGNLNFEIQALGLLGQLVLDLGDPEQARSWFQEASDSAKAYSQPVDEAVQLSHLALAHCRLEDHKEAIRLSDQALATLDREDEESDRLKEAIFERGQIVGAAQGYDAAQPHIEQAYGLLMVVAARISSPDLRHSFLENVTINRAIQTAYESGRLPTPLRRRRARLPHIDAPIGRPLRQDEWIDIEWAVTTPDDDRARSGSVRRRHQLKRMLEEANRQSAAPRVADLAGALGVSQRTVKRDLAELRSEGHSLRTRGGRSV